MMGRRIERRNPSHSMALVLGIAMVAGGCSFRERPDDAYRRAVKTVATQMPSKPHATEQRETRYASGALRERFSVYKDEKGRELMHGVYTKFHPNGQKKIECEFRDDDLVSSITRWDENGQMRASVFSPRIVWKQGAETEWFPNGQKGSEFSYESGIAKKERWWYSSGALAIERTVLDKEVKGIEGVVKVWRPDGRRLREAHWGVGWVTKARLWDESGRETAWNDDVDKR